MDEFFQKVTSQQDPFKKLISYIPGFRRICRTGRTAAMQIRYCAIPWHAASTNNGSALHSSRVDMVSNGMIAYVDDMEKASHPIAHVHRQDQHRLARLCRFVRRGQDQRAGTRGDLQFDAAFFDLAEQVAHALDNVEASLADEAALPAAIRNVVSLARMAVETYNRRSEAVTGSGK